VRSTDHGVTHYKDFSTPLLPCPQIFSSTPHCSNPEIDLSIQKIPNLSYLHLDEGTLHRVIGLAHREGPECYAGGSVAAGRVSLAEQDGGQRSDEERYPDPQGWGLRRSTGTPTLAKMFLS
jgi:hypothetical protein